MAENKKEILSKLEKIQKFIEEPNSKDNYGRNISYFNKLCFVQEDLIKKIKGTK